MLTNIISRNVYNHNLPKYWQLYFSEMLAIIFVEMQMLAIFLLESWRRILTFAIFRIYSNYNFQKCRRQMLAIIISRNAGDES